MTKPLTDSDVYEIAVDIVTGSKHQLNRLELAYETNNPTLSGELQILSYTISEALNSFQKHMKGKL